MSKGNGNPEQYGHCFCPYGSAGKAPIFGRSFEEGCDKCSPKKSAKTKTPLLSNPGLKLIPDFRHLRRKSAMVN